MAAEQTVYEGDDLKVVINVTNDSGSHVAATVNTTTTRVNGFSTAPTVNTIGTGQYEIVFTGLTPAPAEGDRLIVKVNGSVDGGSAWSEYSIPVIVKEPVTGFSTFNAGTDTVDVGAISGDAAAADNLEASYDGTGYIDPTGPAYQSQLSNIAITGAAINTTYTTQNLVSGGVVAGTADNTVARDGVYYQLNDTAGLLDIQFDFEIGADGVPTGVTFYGYLNGGNDSVQVQAYDWVTAQFRTLGTIQGSNGTSPQEYNFALFTSMVGSGANDGTVRIRFYDATLTSADLFIDQLYTSYSVVNRSIGYSNGSIWVNGLTGTSNTVPFIDGTADNPVDSYANALTLNSSLNLRRFTFSPGDVATLTQNMGAIEFLGTNYVVNLGSQVPPTVISGAEVTGVSTSTVTHYMRECRVGTLATPVTLNSGAVLELCGLVNLALKDQAGAALDVEFLDCHGNTQQSMFPGGTVDFGVTPGTNHEVSFQRWGGPVTLKNFKDGDTVYFHGNGTAIFDASCTGGSFRVAGMINVVDNSGGAVSQLDDGRITLSRIADAVWDEIYSDHTAVNTVGWLLRENNLGIIQIAGDVTDLQASVDALPTPPTSAQNAQAVWEYDATTTVASSYGERMNEILLDTDENNTLLLTGVDLSSSALSSINAEVVDVLTVDTFAEPVAVPAATASLKDMIHWNFTVARNKITQTSTTTTLRNDADSATIGSAPVSDDGTTFTRGEYL